MINPLDVWDIGHALVGLSMGSLQLRRWFAYPVKLVWETYQLFFEYQPQGLGLGDVWLDSVFDTLTFAIFYEITLAYAPRIARMERWRRISPRAKGVAAFIFICFGGSFVMGWDLKHCAANQIVIRRDGRQDVGER
jgi:hypothetical protein